MSTATLKRPPERPEPTPAATGAFAFDRAIQATERHRAKHRLTPLLAQWEVLITFFKHGFEIPLLISKDTGTDATQHRTVLTGLMSMGELIWAQTNSGEDLKDSESGYDKSFISANLQYLRSKYQEWYGEKDAELIEQDRKTIWNALTPADK